MPVISPRVWQVSACLLFSTSVFGQSVVDGIDAFNKGDYARAAKLLSQSQDPAGRAFYALTQAATGHCAEALPELTRAFGEKDTRRLAGIALAQCRISTSDFTNAAPVVAELEKDFPSDPDVLYIAADYHMKAWNDAIYRMYQKAPGSWRVDELSAVVFETQGKFPEAIDEYRKAIAKNPKAIDLHYRLGRALLHQSHDPAVLDQARAEFEAEAALNPSDAVAAVAKIRSEAHRYPEAVDLLERAIKLQPRNETAHYSLMMAYRNAGR